MMQKRLVWWHLTYVPVHCIIFSREHLLTSRSYGLYGVKVESM